jgi:hypothetical protein
VVCGVFHSVLYKFYLNLNTKAVHSSVRMLAGWWFIFLSTLFRCLVQRSTAEDEDEGLCSDIEYQKNIDDRYR